MAPEHGRQESEKFVIPCLLRLPDRHSIPGCRGFEPDGEKDDLLTGIRPCDLETIDRRINHPHVSAARLENEEIARGTRHPQHIAKRAKDDIRPAGDRMSLVDHLERGDAHGTARPMHQLDLVGQQLIDTILDGWCGSGRRRLPSAPTDAWRCAEFRRPFFGPTPRYDTRRRNFTLSSSTSPTSNSAS